MFARPPRSARRADDGGVVQDDVEAAGDVKHGDADITSNPIGDNRFAALFQSTDFEIDPSSGACLQQHCLPNVIFV